MENDSSFETILEGKNFIDLEIEWKLTKESTNLFLVQRAGGGLELQTKLHGKSKEVRLRKEPRQVSFL